MKIYKTSIKVDNVVLKMLFQIFTSSIKVENVVESARMSVKVELVLFKGVGVTQLQNLKKIISEEDYKRGKHLPGILKKETPTWDSKKSKHLPGILKGDVQ